MNVDWVRELCLSFPRATEKVTWGSDLTFRIGEKMFAVAVLEPAPVWLSFKCSPETFAELTERMDIIPAPYLARAHWVALETRDALGKEELSRLLRESYELIVAKLPKGLRQTIARSGPSPSPKRLNASRKRRRKRS
jgi:predicted DNA-binding protein (MmcQ/YjbR family)